VKELPAAVTFDCWNTLLREHDWREAHRRRVDGLLHAARESGARVSTEQAEQAFDQAWKRHIELWEQGEASGARHVADWAMHELGARTHGASFELLVAHFEHASHSSVVVPVRGAVETIEALTRCGVPCALICDTGLTPGSRVRELLRDVGLLDRLEALIFSDEVGVPKPHARMFHAALGALGVEASDAVHVGDLRRADVAGGRAVGMGTIRIRDHHDDRSEHPEADLVAHTHAHLRRLLGCDS
jgi:putative hydrolase of the HAD superfamily